MYFLTPLKTISTKFILYLFHMKLFVSSAILENLWRIDINFNELLSSDTSKSMGKSDRSINRTEPSCARTDANR